MTARATTPVGGSLRRLAAVTALVTAFGGGLLLMSAASAGAAPGDVTLCHATGSETNPFVVITINPAGAYNGHLGDDHQDGEDIIPPFEYQGQTYSQNWNTAGQAIHRNGCKEGTPPTSSSPPTNGGEDGKVTLCHATGSESNPFVVISPSAAGAFNGHLGNSHQNGEDIIPPFEYQGQTYSQNWDAEGMAIFENGCKPAAPGTQTPPPTKPGESVTPPPTKPGEHVTPPPTKPGEHVTPPVVSGSSSSAAAVPTTRRSPGPIPGAVDAGLNTGTQWQWPVGGALLLLGTAGAVTALTRRSATRR
jgi:hypothetical protein